MADRQDANPLLEVEDEIRRFENDRISPFRFRPALEGRFLRETRAVRTRMLNMQGMLALFAYNFFIVGDYFMAPSEIGRAVMVRFGIVTPLVLVVAFFARRIRSNKVQEFLAACLCVAGTISILYLHDDVSSQVTSEAQVGLILVLLVVNCMLRLDVPFAFGTSVVVVLADFSWLAIDQMLERSEKMVSGGMLFWVALLAMNANYSLTRERRFSYLLQLRGRLQRGLLAEANAELMAISSTDRLTGIPNRRAYDLRLQELWQLSQENREPLSAVIVDVDHFKRLNDTYGHPYGDRVLQRIASLLQQALRAEDDFAARIGGEEFVVLLPDCTPDVALKVAERIRTLVQVAGSPALQRDSSSAPVEVWATVSCGVATVWPHRQIGKGAKGHDAATLIAEADAALYRAKQEGRNRVCCAVSGAQPSKITVFPSSAVRG